MLISTATETALQRETTHLVDDQPYKGREYIGSAPKPGTAGYGQNVAGDDAPQAYLVSQPPHSTTRPHFHQTNQFQLFVGGGGSVGKLRADPLTVQYAGGNTPYGPIVAEDDGIQYFTLRQAWDSGAKYLPAMNDMLVKGQQRQVIGVKSSYGADQIPRGDGATKTEFLIAPTTDGLLIQWLGLSPGSKTTLPDAAEGGGQYHVVVSGSLRRAGRDLSAMSVEFASTDEGEVEIEAGADGLEMMLLRFPRAHSKKMRSEF
ncbi:MAG: hypothetical protein HQ502_04630 [Alphaproteobacteria bacterium]|nr:hypothetical protein [Alphaproteobacteria bacterium]